MGCTMRHKTLFRLMLKVVGVWVLVQPLASLPHLISTMIELWSSGMGLSLEYLVPTWLGWALHLAMGLYLFFGGRWIVDLAIPSNRPYCPECGYDLSSTSGSVCPECGVTVPNSVRDQIGQASSGS